MSARTDLDNALQYLTDGITAHVAALKAARDASNNTDHIVELTAKINALAAVVLTSTAAV